MLPVITGVTKHLLFCTSIVIRHEAWIYIIVINLRSVACVRFIPRLLSIWRILFRSGWWLNNRVTRWTNWSNIISRGNCNISEITWWSVSTWTRSFKSWVYCPLRFSGCVSKSIRFYRIILTYIMNLYTWVSNLFVISRSRSRIESITRRFKFLIFTPFGRFCTDHFTRKILAITGQGLQILVCARCWYTHFNRSHFIIIIIYFILNLKANCLWT